MWPPIGQFFLPRNQPKRHSGRGMVGCAVYGRARVLDLPKPYVALMHVGGDVYSYGDRKRQLPEI